VKLVDEKGERAHEHADKYLNALGEQGWEPVTSTPHQEGTL
jgi:hypothetical protein